MSAAEASSRSAPEVAPPLCALLRLKAASERPSAFVPSSQATLLSAGKSDCGRRKLQDVRRVGGVRSSHGRHFRFQIQSSTVSASADYVLHQLCCLRPVLLLPAPHRVETQAAACITSTWLPRSLSSTEPFMGGEA